jgi:hypothetical protein
MKPKAKNGSYRRVPVTVLILVLIVAVAAPSLAFTGLLLLQADNVTRGTMGLRASQGVDGIAEALERELQNMSTNLALLATSGWVETEDYGRLHARASQALAGTDAFLIAIDQQNNQILNTRVPWGTPAGPVSDPVSVATATSTGRPALSNKVFSKVAGKDVFNVVLPVLSGESRLKALILTRDADKLPSIFQ